ncbi:MAG: biotin transporter BioY [Ignavibacteria bacterium]
MTINENVKSNVGIKIINGALSSGILWVSGFALLTVIAAQVSVPVQPVPFTLQTMFVILAGAFLGAKNGAYSQGMYLAMGALGLPVFANLSGFTSLLGPTAGYLLAFPAGAFIAGLLIQRSKSFASVFISMTVANLAIVFTGATYLSLFFNRTFSDALFVGGVVFSVWDLIKIAAASGIYFAISKKYHRLPL